ncbi:hypothetical protein CRUP_038540, partial [Coryphaenoides rupestris]
TDGGHNCVGPDKSFSSCNVQDCSEGSKDFREEQCSQFDGSDFQGKRYKWLPYYGGCGEPCELNCMPRGENFFYRHRSAVADGTPCHPGRRDICVDGVCKRLGCDQPAGLLQQEDACLQCGGSGRSCRRVHNTFTTNGLPNGYNQMLIIPVGATSIRIAETVPTRNYLAIKNLRGEYYLNGHWVIEFSRSTPVAGTVLFYQRGAEGGNTPETIVGRGPTTEPLVIEMISQELNQGVDFEYYLPNGRSREGYFWSYGSWTPCSFQSRLVFCAIDNEAYPDYLCASLPRPSSNRTCNAQACPQTRRVAFLYGPLMWSQAQRPRTLVYSWKTGEWNACSVTCGGGSQLRSVQCVSHDASGPRVVEDTVCSAHTEAPPTLQTCNMHRGHDNTQTVFTPYVPADPTATALDVSRTTNAVQDPHHHGSAPAIHCSQSQYGCCPDGRIAAGGLRGLGCPRAPATPPATAAVEPTAAVQPAGTCARTSHGCCRDGVTSARGPNKEGCREYVAAVPTVSLRGRRLPPTTNAQQCRTTTYGCCYDRTTPAAGPAEEGCPDPPGNLSPSQPFCPDFLFSRPLLPVLPASTSCQWRDPCARCPAPAGSCADWSARFHYDVVNARCVHFWYGNCHGKPQQLHDPQRVPRGRVRPSPSSSSPPRARPAGPGARLRARLPGRGVGAGGGAQAGGQRRHHAHRARNHMRFHTPPTAPPTAPPRRVLAWQPASVHGA